MNSDGNSKNGLHPLLEVLLADIFELDEWLEAGHKPLCVDYQFDTAKIVDAFVNGHSLAALSEELRNAFDYVASCPICWQTIVDSTEALGGRVPEDLSYLSRLGHALSHAAERVAEMSRWGLKLYSPFPSTTAVLGEKAEGVAEDEDDDGTLRVVAPDRDLEITLRSEGNSFQAIFHVVVYDESNTAIATLLYPQPAESGQLKPGAGRLVSGQTECVRFRERSIPGSETRYLLRLQSSEDNLHTLANDWAKGPLTEAALLRLLDALPSEAKERICWETFAYRIDG